MSAHELNGRSNEPSIMRPPVHPSCASVWSSQSWMDCVGIVVMWPTAFAMTGRASSDGALDASAPTGMAEMT